MYSMNGVVKLWGVENTKALVIGIFRPFSWSFFAPHFSPPSCFAVCGYFVSTSTRFLETHLVSVSRGIYLGQTQKGDFGLHKQAIRRDVFRRKQFFRSIGATTIRANVCTSPLRTLSFS